MRLRIYLLIALALIFAFLSGVFILGDEKSHKLEPTEFMTIFENKKYSKLIEKLSSLQHVILKGYDEDGVDVFVNYALNVTLAEEHTVNQRSLFAQKSQLQDISYPLFSKIRSFFIESIDQTPLNQVWVIDSNGPLTQQHGAALNELIASYPNDRVIVVTPEVEIKLPSFKTINFFRPQDKVVENLLKKQGLTGEQIRLVLENHKNNLEQLQVSYDQGSLLDHEEAFKAQKVIVTNQLQQAESKVLGFLKKLCRYGKLPTKSQISGLDAMQAVGYAQDGYYWFSKNYLLAYESTISIHCQDPQFFIETKNVVSQSQEQVLTEQIKTEVVDKTTEDQQTQHEEQNTVQESIQQVKNKQKNKSKKREAKEQSKVEIQQNPTQKSKDKVKKKPKKQQQFEQKKQQQKINKKKVEKAVTKQEKPKKSTTKQQIKKQSKKNVKKQIEAQQKQQRQTKTIKKVSQKQTIKQSQKPVEIIVTKSQKSKLTNKNTKQQKTPSKQSSKVSKQSTNKKQKKDQKKKR